MSSPTRVTKLLLTQESDRQDAFDKLLTFIYGDLRRLAVHYLWRERPNHTLHLTFLINETNLRLVDQTRTQSPNFSPPLRSFGGLSTAETIKLWMVPTAIMSRQWRAAKAWHHPELNEGGAV